MKTQMEHRPQVLLGVALMAMLLGPPVAAQTCDVPGSHATIQEAANDPACDTILLEAATYTESVEVFRSLTLAGPVTGGAVIEGAVWARLPTVQLILDHLTLQSGCPDQALRVEGSAQVSGTGLEVFGSSSLPCPPFDLDALFVDGFESGDLTAWSGSTG